LFYLVDIVFHVQVYPIDDTVEFNK